MRELRRWRLEVKAKHQAMSHSVYVGRRKDDVDWDRPYWLDVAPDGSNAVVQVSPEEYERIAVGDQMVVVLIHEPVA